MKRLKYIIQQLLPGAGWRAMFANEDCSDWIVTPLIAWVLIQYKEEPLEGLQSIQGIIPLDEMNGELTIASYHDDFIGYLGPHGQEFIDAEEMKIRLDIIREDREQANA